MVDGCRVYLRLVPWGSLEMGGAVAVSSPRSPGRLWRSFSGLGTILGDCSYALFFFFFFRGRVCVAGLGLLALAKDVLEFLTLRSAGIISV